MEFLLGFLEPAALGDAPFLLSGRPRLLLWLTAREGEDHDRDGEDREKPNQRKKWDRGE